MMPARLEAYKANFDDTARILSGGGMIGSAILFPVIRHDSFFYQYLTMYIFGISTLIYNALNWRAVMRYYFLALVTVLVPVIIVVPYGDASTFSFPLERMPLLVMLWSLAIDEYARLAGRPLGSEEVPMAPSLAGTPAYNASDGLRWRRMSVRSLSEWGDRSFPLLPDQRDALLMHMQGAEREFSHPSSQEPSDISLSSALAEAVPSSYDSMTRSFWHDEFTTMSQTRNASEEES
ncbi:hypothetical protein F5B20DRAFT_490983 [Whalleya microplaca]|nr:hypothetical protein F5B20DRAFT_490983 [Whalleya microplaca]